MLATENSRGSSTAVPFEPQPVASLTPYLDRQTPLPPPNWGYRPIPPWQTVLILSAFLLRTPFEMYLLILAGTLVHELGHCLAGLAAGLELDRIRVGPLELDPYKRLTWQWNRGTIMGGYALMLPRAKTAIRTRLAAYIAGGPIANVACGIATLHMMPTHPPHFVGLAQLFVAGSFIGGLGNLVPFRRYGVSSDGMKLLMLLLNRSERWIFLLSRHAAIRNGETNAKQEIDPALVGRSDGSSDYVGANWVAYTLSDGKGDYDQAAKYLEACLEKCHTVEPSFHRELILAAARFQATRRKKTGLAWQWLNSANREKSKISYAYTEGLILFSEGKVNEALAKADEVSDLVSHLPPGEIKTLQERAARQLREIIGKSTLDPKDRSNASQYPR